MDGQTSMGQSRSTLHCSATNNPCSVTSASHGCDALFRGYLEKLSNWTANQAGEGDASVLRDAGTFRSVMQLRHDRFRRQQGKRYTSICTDDAIFVEPCDLGSVLTVACDERGLSLGIRFQHLAAISDNSNYRSLAEAVVAMPDYERCLLMTRFVAARPQVNPRQLISLFKLNYGLGLASGRTRCLLTTSPQHASLYAKFGFVCVGQYASPLAGGQSIMSLDLHDTAHLRDVRSPLLGAAEAAGLS